MISVLAQASAASTATGYIIGGSVIAGVIATLRIVEWVRPKLRPNGNGCSFTGTQAEKLKELVDFHAKTDGDGLPLCYQPRGLVTAIEAQTVSLQAQTSMLNKLSATIDRQHDLVQRRLEVCEKHTSTLIELRGELKRGKGA